MTPINNNQMSELREIESHILTALTFKGIDVKANDFITPQEAVISTSGSIDGLQTEGLGFNSCWKDFIHKELSTFISHERAEAVRGFAQQLDKSYVLRSLNGKAIISIKTEKSITLSDKAEEYLKEEGTQK